MWPFSTIKRLTAERDRVRANIKLLSAAHEKLRAKLKQAHFRNPKTGRLGVKGQTFD